MKLAILKVVLWPSSGGASPRIVAFEPGKINVITGESGSGKSTLTWIIDYCLGSDKCSIPVGLIRDSVSWFGLHLKLANTELLVARRNPGAHQSTTDIYWVEGLQLEIPTTIEKNARVDDLKNRLNQISHLPSLDLSTEEKVGYAGRASCRDMAAFNFQPQHIVANPYTFFFKTDTTEHREKLRVVIPLALGAVNAATLARQHELKDLEREHERLAKELEVRLAAAGAWEAEVESYYVQAREMGLLPGSLPPEANWPQEKYIRELQKVGPNVRAKGIPDIQEGATEGAIDELNRIIGDENRLAGEIGAIRRRLGKIDQLSTSVGEYGAALVNQEDRLQSAGWLAEKIKDTHECPVCSAAHPNGNPRLVELVTLAKELKTVTTSITRAPARLDREVATMRHDAREKETFLAKARQKRRSLEDQSTALSAQRQQVRQIYLFVGRIEQALENVSASSNVGDLRTKVRELLERVAAIRCTGSRSGRGFVPR